MSRTGVIANKIGMTRIYDEFGRSVPVTVLQLDNVQVTAQRTNAKDGYTAVQVGAGKAKLHRVNKAQKAVFNKTNIEAKKKIDREDHRCSERKHIRYWKRHWRFRQ